MVLIKIGDNVGHVRPHDRESGAAMDNQGGRTFYLLGQGVNIDHARFEFDQDAL